MCEKKELLSIRDLTVEYVTQDMGVCHAVNDVTLSIRAGETLGLVGETGAGKTTIALSIMRLLQVPPAKVVQGEIDFEGQNLLTLSEAKMRSIRGNRIAMIYQDPMTALNPVDSVGDQIMEVVLLHDKHLSKKDARIKAMEMLEMVGIPAERYKDFPHQFSGGMKQRVVIAMALACNPILLIADEPTTALDVTIQAQVLDMISELKQKLNTSMLLITHDLGVVAETCDSVAVIYAGEIVEIGTADHIFRHTAHPYTKGLFDSLPDTENELTRLKPIRGLMPDPANLPSGCKFAPRCNYCTKSCMENAIPLTEYAPGHYIRCIHPEYWNREEK